MPLNGQLSGLDAGAPALVAYLLRKLKFTQERS